MNKKNIAQFLTFWALLFVVFSCSEDLIKSDYDADTSKLPTLTLSVSDINYDTAYAVGSYTLASNGDDSISECGFLVSTDSSFFQIESVVTDTNLSGTSFSGIINLYGSTKYYVKSYTVSKNGTAVSEAVSFTTPDAPTFEDEYLFGVYTESDYDQDSTFEASYDSVLFIEKEGSVDQFYIYNFWGGGETVVANVDFETKTFTIDPQVIYVDGSYGDCYIYYFYIDSDEWTYNTTDAIVGEYDDAGNITIGAWGAGVSAGFFGTYSYSTLTKTSD